MIKKKTKIEVQYFQISIFVNLLAFVIILWLLFRRKTNNQSRTPTQSLTSTKSKLQSLRQSARLLKETNKTNQQIKDKIILQRENSLYSNHNRSQQIMRQNSLQSTEQLINILQEQLKLQRDQNQLLQEKNQILQQQIQKISLNAINHKESLQVTNLKNELQFCQMRLNQSIKNEAALMLKLADYETMSITMLNHPQYHRLRQLNNTYKDTISKLQNQLLSRHQSKNHYVDLSFHL